LATAAGCGEETGGLPPPASPPPGTPSGPTPGPSLSPAEQEAVDEARARFDEFMNAYVEVSTADLPTAETAEDLFAQVDQHVGGGELSQDLRSEIVGRWGESHVLDGALEWDFVDVVEVDLDREVEGDSSPLVGLRYCVDASTWVSVDAATRTEVGQPGQRRLWSAAVVWSDDWFGQGIAGWRVRTREQEERC
jgi:hypothetical protein